MRGSVVVGDCTNAQCRVKGKICTVDRMDLSLRCLEILDYM